MVHALLVMGVQAQACTHCIDAQVTLNSPSQVQTSNAIVYFQVMRNALILDKTNIDSGLVRIRFTEYELDVVISCSNPAELKVFIGTMEVVQHLTPLRYWSDTQCHYPSLWCCPKFSNCNRCTTKGSPNVSNIPLQILYDIFRRLEVTMDTIDVVQRLCPMCNCVNTRCV